MPTIFKQAELPNGLSIIAECDDAAYTSAIGFFVRTGARDEQPAVMGVSHFLEHMMFKGTDKRSSDDVNREFDAMGARSNAYTSSEMTAFHAAVLPEHLASATEVLADMMRPALRETDFDTERGVILEEIAMYADDPVWTLYEKALEEHYRRHPLAHRVLGTKETIGELKVGSMRAYFADRYSADNTVVALAGKVDFDKAVQQIGSLCGHWQRTGATRRPDQPSFSPGQFELRDEKVTRAYRVLLAEGPGMTDPRRYAAFVMAQLLGGADNSRLHWALIETGLAEEADAGYDPRDGVGDLRLFVATTPEQMEKAWEIALKELAGLADSITPEEVERIRSKVATGVVVAGERPDGRMHRLGRQFMYDRNYTTLEEELARTEKVTVDDVRSLLREMPWTPRTVGTLLPAE